jgi:tetratricopeptide (TPR) repeat protein
MNKSTKILILGLTLTFDQVIAQAFQQQFNELVSKKDTLGQEHLLTNWEKADSNDPELYVAWFNYFVNKSRKEVIAIGQNPKGKDVLNIMDKDSTNKNPVSYMYGDTYYNHNVLNKGFSYIEKGLAKYPNRLDFRFGKIYMYEQIGDYESFTNNIIEVINYSAVNQNKWTWAENKVLDDSKYFMLNSIQDYQLQLYNSGKDELLNNMKSIAEVILKYYPDHIESLSNLSVVFMIQKEYDKALEQLFKAEKLNPKDFIVLNNIAQAYKLKGDTKNAISYYELAMKYGNDQAKNYAKDQIKELKKK